MQFVLAFLAPLFAALFVNAVPAAHFRRANPSGAGQCNTAPTHCCDTVAQTSSLDESTTNFVANLVGVAASDLANGVGIGCSSLVGGASCSTNTLCCENDTFNGLVAVGCVGAGVNA